MIKQRESNVKVFRPKLVHMIMAALYASWAYSELDVLR